MTLTERPYAHLGEQIDHLMHALALAKSWRMKRATQEVFDRAGYDGSTIYRWRQGRLRPPDETLNILARLGNEHAGLDRFWGTNLLKAARYPDAEHLLDEIWGAKEIHSILNNLPALERTVFVGRQRELARLLELLSPDHAAHLISVDGIGGVGKTTLVLEAAFNFMDEAITEYRRLGAYGHYKEAIQNLLEWRQEGNIDDRIPLLIEEGIALFKELGREQEVEELESEYRSHQLVEVG